MPGYLLLEHRSLMSVSMRQVTKEIGGALATGCMNPPSCRGREREPGTASDRPQRPVAGIPSKDLTRLTCFCPLDCCLAQPPANLSPPFCCATLRRPVTMVFCPANRSPNNHASRWSSDLVRYLIGIFALTRKSIRLPESERSALALSSLEICPLLRAHRHALDSHDCSDNQRICSVNTVARQGTGFVARLCQSASRTSAGLLP